MKSEEIKDLVNQYGGNIYHTNGYDEPILKVASKEFFNIITYNCGRWHAPDRFEYQISVALTHFYLKYYKNDKKGTYTVLARDIDTEDIRLALYLLVDEKDFINSVIEHKGNPFKVSDSLGIGTGTFDKYMKLIIRSRYNSEDKEGIVKIVKAYSSKHKTML